MKVYIMEEEMDDKTLYYMVHEFESRLCLNSFSDSDSAITFCISKGFEIMNKIEEEEIK